MNAVAARSRKRPQCYRHVCTECDDILLCRFCRLPRHISNRVFSRSACIVRFCSCTHLRLLLCFCTFCCATQCSSMYVCSADLQYLNEPVEQVGAVLDIHVYVREELAQADEDLVKVRQYVPSRHLTAGRQAGSMRRNATSQTTPKALHHQVEPPLNATRLRRIPVRCVGVDTKPGRTQTCRRLQILSTHALRLPY